MMLDHFPATSGLVCTVLVLLVYYLWNRHQRLKSLPPGPTPLPLLGNLLDLASSDQLETFRKLREKYGDLVTLHVGSFTMVVVSGYDTLRELFVKRGDVTSDRPDLFVFREITKGEGIASRSGKEWKLHRRITSGGLREFGFDKKSLEENIMKEIEHFLDFLEKSQGQAINPESCVNICITNILCAILFGMKYEHDDPVLRQLTECITEMVSLIGAAGPINLIPSLRFVPGIQGLSRVLDNSKKLSKYIYDIIDAHEKDYDEENIKDFIDVYLKELKSKEGQDTSLTVSQLKNTIFDMFVVGINSSTIIMLWTILLLLNNPDVQERCHEEVMRVVGEGRSPSLSDRPDMPYIEATITEVLRFGDITPLGLPHVTNSDIIKEGFQIPKGTMLITNINSVHIDPELFPQPEKFQPSRFINKDGKVFGPDRVIPFFFGRRMCMGQQLVRSELFLFLTSMVQRFIFKPADPNNTPSVNGHFQGVGRTPYQYKCLAQKR